MWLRLLAVISVIVAGAASGASAALILHIEQKEVVPSDADQVVYLDAYLEDPDNVNELLNAFGLTVQGPDNTPSGVRFAPSAVGTIPLPSPAHPYVLRDSPYMPEDYGSTYDTLFTGAGGERTVNADVSPSRNGMVAIPVIIPAGTPPGAYRFEIDADRTSFGVSGAGIPYTLGQPGRITIVPEPSCTALAAPAVLLLRRRRRAR